LVTLTSIGSTLKAHGKEGQLRISCDDRYMDDLESARAVFLNLNGSRVPFLIESIEFKNHILLKLEEVDTPEEASRFALKDLLLESDALQHSDTEEQESATAINLLQYRVYDSSGNYMGRIQEHIVHPHQELLRIAGPEKTFLCPFHEDMVDDFSEEELTIRMNLPDGITEL